MFDVYYRSLSKEQRNEFSEKCGLSQDTIKNTYMAKDPLKRRMPKPETMVAFIKHSGGALNIIGIMDYFHVATMVELMKLDNMPEQKIRHSLSIFHPANYPEYVE